MSLVLVTAAGPAPLRTRSPEATPGTVVRFDVRRTAHEWLGFGANIWPGDTAVEPVLRELNARWARLWAGSPSGAPGPDGTREEFDAYWSRHPGMPGARATASMLARLRVRTVLCIGAPPSEWLEQAYHLNPKFHAAFARNWGAAVAAHVRAGVRPAYIELYNEPDGYWGIHVSAAENAALTRIVRAELDARGLRDVGICGPGTAHADWGPDGDRYIEAMGPDDVAALAAWSNHAWEWNGERINAEGGQNYLREAWPSVVSSIRRKDPTRRRPVLVTEFATKAHAFHGKTYPDQGAPPADFKASDTPAYAVRVVANALHLLAGGAGALMVWEGADQEWSQHDWGLITRPSRGSRPRPVYEALRATMPWLPVGGQVVPTTTLGGYLAAAAVRKGRVLAVVVANPTARPRTIRLEVSGARTLRVTGARAFRDGATRVVTLKPVGRALVEMLPPDSALAVTCEVRP